MKKINRADVTYLHPGNAIITNTSKVICTVLGSCIAITMYVQRLKIGAIAHCLLPKPGEKENSECPKNSYAFRYISCAIQSMMESLRNMGIDNEEIEVKVFGGANVISENGKNGKLNSIGQQNVSVVNELLAAINLKIKAYDTGGNFGRKIYFFTNSGEVYLTKIKKFNDKQEKIELKNLISDNEKS